MDTDISWNMFLTSGEYFLTTGEKKFYQQTVTLIWDPNNNSWQSQAIWNIKSLIQLLIQNW